MRVLSIVYTYINGEQPLTLTQLHIYHTANHIRWEDLLRKLVMYAVK